MRQLILQVTPLAPGRSRLQRFDFCQPRGSEPPGASGLAAGQRPI